MALETFGVTPAAVKAHHFPQLSSGFSLSSSPSSVTVTEMIQSEAAELGGALRVEGLDASSLTALANPNAYAWCADTIRLGAAIRAGRAMTGVNADVIKAWDAELQYRYKELDAKSLALLGDASSPAGGDANAVRSHITDDLVMPFSRDDKL